MNDKAFAILQQINERFIALHSQLPYTKAADRLRLAFRDYFRLVLSLHIPGKDGNLKKLSDRSRNALIMAYNRLQQEKAAFSGAGGQKAIKALMDAVSEYHSWIAGAAPATGQDIVQLENRAVENDIIKKNHLDPELVNQAVVNKDTLGRSMRDEEMFYNRLIVPSVKLGDQSSAKVGNALCQAKESRKKIFFQKAETHDLHPWNDNRNDLPEIARRYLLPQEVEAFRMQNQALSQSADEYFKSTKSLRTTEHPSEIGLREEIDYVVLDIGLAAKDELTLYELQKLRVEQKLCPVLRRVQRDLDSNRDLRVRRQYSTFRSWGLAPDLKKQWKRGDALQKQIHTQLGRFGLRELDQKLRRQDQWISETKAELEDLPLSNLTLLETMVRPSRTKLLGWNGSMQGIPEDVAAENAASAFGEGITNIIENRKEDALVEDGEEKENGSVQQARIRK